MKKSLHPEYNVTTIVCNSCNKTYMLGTTVEGLKVELCSNCHPFYTGKQVLVDTDNLVEKFNKKKEAAKTFSTKSKKVKNEKRRSSAPKQAVTLKDMLSNLK